MQRRLKRFLKQLLPKSARVSPKRQAYLNYKEVARRVITGELATLAHQYGFVYKRVAIRDTKRSWGSCSAHGNLNFSYKLLFVPDCIREYVIVHELCHLRHLHHRAEFWAEVALHMPDYEARRQELRRFERSKGTSRPVLLAWKAAHETGCDRCLRLANGGSTNDNGESAILT
jgi:predicted metal-dependent hydrolase